MNDLNKLKLKGIRTFVIIGTAIGFIGGIFTAVSASEPVYALMGLFGGAYIGLSVSSLGVIVRWAWENSGFYKSEERDFFILYIIKTLFFRTLIFLFLLYIALFVSPIVGICRYVKIKIQLRGE